MVEDKANLVERPMSRLKAFIGRKDFQRLAKVVEGSKNFTRVSEPCQSVKDQGKWSRQTPPG